MRLLLVALLLLPGCLPRVARVNVPGIERSDAVRVQDLRPATEKQRKLFSALITRASYGIYRHGDDALAPSPLRLLQHRAHEVLGAADIQVHHLVAYSNMAAEFRRGAAAAAMSVVGVIATGGAPIEGPPGATGTLVNASTFEALSAAQEYQRARYTEEENPGQGSVHVVYIDTEIDGRRVFTRTIAPAPDGIVKTLPDAMEAAIQFHLSQYQSDSPPPS